MDMRSVARVCHCTMSRWLSAKQDDRRVVSLEGHVSHAVTRRDELCVDSLCPFAQGFSVGWAVSKSMKMRYKVCIYNMTMLEPITDNTTRFSVQDHVLRN